MRWNRYFISMALLACSMCAMADDSISAQQPVESKYEKTLHRKEKAWASLIPTHFAIQNAGNMGVLSAGIGWSYGKRRQWETDLFFGVKIAFIFNSAVAADEVAHFFFRIAGSHALFFKGGKKRQGLESGGSFGGSGIWFRQNSRYAVAFGGAVDRAVKNAVLKIFDDVIEGIGFLLQFKVSEFISQRGNGIFGIMSSILDLIAACQYRYGGQQSGCQQTK